MRLLFIAVLIASVSTIPDDTSDFQDLLPAHVVWAVSGGDAELPCDLTTREPGDRVNMVLWFKDASGIPLYSLDNREGDLARANHSAISNDIGARTYFQTVGVQPARLRVNSVGVSDEGMFRCRIDFLNSPTRNYKVRLNIVVAPSRPVIYDHKGKEVTGMAGPFLEGFEMYLACHVMGGRPAPEVTWWLDDRILDKVIEARVDDLTVNQLFLPNVQRSFYGKQLECRAQSSDMTKPISRTTPLDIYLKPTSVRIETSRTLMSAGKLHFLQCITVGSIPSANIVWLLDGEHIKNAATTVTENRNSTSSSLSFRPSAVDDGKEIVCRAENPHFRGGIIEDKIRLLIAYPPVVSVQLEERGKLGPLKEGDDVKMTCEVRANPLPDKMTWYHKDSLITYDEGLGTFPMDRTLKLRNLEKESAGEYSCAASNAEGESRSGPVLLRIQFSPRCKPGYESRRMGAIKRQVLMVECEVIADPADDVKFSWTYNKSRDVLPVPGTRVKSAGLVSRLQYSPSSDDDYGTLACWASNSIGKQAKPCLVHIIPASLPGPPEECLLRNSSSGGLEVVCIPGHDGDLPQHFLLEVSESPTSPNARNTPSSHSTMNDEGIRRETDGPPLYQLLGAKPNFVLHSLQPGKNYELAVYAVNAKGRSDPPVIIPRVTVATAMEKLTGTDSDEAEKSTSNQPMAIILGVLIAAAVLILGGIFITATLVICKRRATASQIHNRERDAQGKTSRDDQTPTSLHHDELMNMMVPVPCHVILPERTNVLPRVRLRTEEVEMLEQPLRRTSRSVHGIEDEGGGEIETGCGGGRKETETERRLSWRRSKNDPDLIVSRAELVLKPSPTAVKQPTSILKMPSSILKPSTSQSTETDTF